MLGQLLAATALAAGSPAAKDDTLYLGADLSYVNEMEDCGAVYRERGKPVDPFALLKAKGGNIVRVRLWNAPDWTRYSNYDDVLKTIRRAHAAGLKVLLDFHYSDDWADGEKQRPPAAWAKLDTDAQVKAVYDYTREILGKLAAQGLMPDMVQVGNETNPELMGGVIGEAIHWERNARLFNAGIKAVRDAGKASGTRPKVMLHIAQPENVIPWFDQATVAGVLDYDVIGISYYRKWSKLGIDGLGKVIAAAKDRYKADVIVVETAYPFTNDGADASPNLLGPDTLIPGYPATPDGQRRYLIDLTQQVVTSGGIGVVYWEPAWVSTRCKTRWGTGSNWENAAWFDLDKHEALPAFDFLRHAYRLPQK
ncbi:arabinogalactan endo-1,4-beta-galactosidase [uncultured Sphingomonas sp.]|uniref:glycoside hydrolase family 53 protein n=1 Tax=uncultured Sphingomonas sp. TaxID=158754 RepID=UPI0025D62889|nr:arabinogalactan endo-1,4-beta-galactosidase [uncultured Sphingomonas sp.]